MWLTEILAKLFVRHRWLITLLVVALTAIALAGHLGSTFEKRIGESGAGIRDRQARDLFNELSDQFDMELTECLVVVDGEDLFTKDNILALRDIRETLRELPQVASVIWVDDLPSLNLFGLSEPLLPNRDAEPSEYVDARTKVLGNPLAAGQLVSPDATTAMMPVVYRWVEFRQESDLTDALIDAATRVLAEKHPQANLRVRLTGRVPILQAVEQSFTSNQLKFQIIGYVLVVVLSVFLFRGWRAVFIVGAAPVMGIFWSLGLLDFFQFQRNSLTSIVMPVLVMMVGMTDGIHMMLHIRRNQAAGLDRLQAVRDAIVRVGPACALTSLTTAIGFASLLLAQSEFIRNFGKGCMWAVIICFVAVDHHHSPALHDPVGPRSALAARTRSGRSRTRSVCLSHRLFDSSRAGRELCRHPFDRRAVRGVANLATGCEYSRKPALQFVGDANAVTLRSGVWRHRLRSSDGRVAVQSSIHSRPRFSPRFSALRR